MIFYSLVNLPIVGPLLLLAGQHELKGVYFADRRHAPIIEPAWNQTTAHPLFRRAAEEIGEYLAGDREVFTLPLRYQGTTLQRTVWAEISRIPYGRTLSYSDLARRVHADAAVRAVAAATAQNPLSILIPCHRVVGKDGTLRGYAGGLETKERLLRIEQASAAPQESPSLLFAV